MLQQILYHDELIFRVNKIKDIYYPQLLSQTQKLDLKQIGHNALRLKFTYRSLQVETETDEILQ